MQLLDDPVLRPPALDCAARGTVGTVTLVGAGPGDPDLLTVKAARALRQASLVLHDHLVGQEVLTLVPPAAQRIYVGKESSRHTLSQEAIIELMVSLAREGRALVRLKGGDGYIFGRGGEEAQALALAGIPFEVIPGLSAAQGAAASVGIPLTHRDHAGTLIFATGHGREDREIDLDWDVLARPRQTVVVYMGVATLPTISAQLIAHGMDPQTPAALVERATRPDERCITGSIATLPTLALVHRVRPPALIVIGTVVSLQPLLSRAVADRSGLRAPG
jgi:uroporphyrin-III C-methyltransferase